MLAKKLIAVITTVLLLFGCSSLRTVPVTTEHKIETHYIDSTRWHDSTIYHIIPIEKYRDYTSLLDTLKMETSLAIAKSYVDTTNNTLKGSIENKEDSIKTVIKWKEHIVYRDSIEKVEVPVPVEVTKEVTKYPKTYWWFMGFTILAALYVALKIYMRIKFHKTI